MTRRTLLVLSIFLILHYAVAIRWSNANVPKINFTIEAAEGTSSHGSSRTICYPLTWPSFATFYIGNFGAHIATVQSTPGDKWPLTLFNMVLALFFPTSGLMRGLNAIARNFTSSFFARKVIASIFCIEKWRRDETSLERACKAGALCVVVRNANWRPKPGQVDIPAVLREIVQRRALEESQDVELENVEAARPADDSFEGSDIESTLNAPDVDSDEPSLAELKPREAVLTIYRPTWLEETRNAWWTHFDTLWGRNIVDPTLKAVHGSYKLPDGYSFSILPRHTIVRDDMNYDGVEKPEREIAASYSILKVLASIIQLLAATYTLWLHRGDQTTRWGFASFSFVPVPYAIMSLVNGISHLFTPDYPALYMISSPVMEEAENVGGYFRGVVGHVEPENSSNLDNGYGAGFDSNWKGLTPGILRRTLLSFYNYTKGRKIRTSNLIVSEEGLPGCERSEDSFSETHTNDENTGLTPTAHRTGLPVLLVVQPPSLRRESYIIKAVHRSDNAIESTWYKVPKISLKWVRFGTIGIIVLLGLIVFNLVCHPKQTYLNLKEQGHTMKARIQTFLSGIPRSHGDTASNITIQGSLKRRLFALLYLTPTFEDFRLSEQLREDKLPRISFRACERFQHHDEATRNILDRTPSPRFRGIVAQALLVVSISGLSLLVIGLMSGFDAGMSSKAEQIILMMWLAVGVVVGFLVPFLNINDAFTLLIRIPLELHAAAGSRAVLSSQIGPSLMLQTMILMCIPWSMFVVPVWGFVIVGVSFAPYEPEQID